MKKYLLIISNEIQRQFTFRASILSYVGGNFIELFISIVLWTAIYKSRPFVQGFSRPEMISYVVVGWYFMMLSTNYWFEEIIAWHIREGRLAGFLTKPQSYLRYIFALSLGRITIALAVSILQGIAYILLFRGKMVFSDDWRVYVILAAMLVFAYLIRFFLAVIAGLMGFWILEVDGAYYAFEVIVKFLSGSYFPLSLFPLLLKVSVFFPFMYTLYFPAMVFLGKASLSDGVKGLFIQIAWTAFLYLIIKAIWSRGIRRFEAVGI
jgi:ABC-2 type transport system permease protein